MACVPGKVIFHREDGSVEVEKIFKGEDPRKAGLFAKRRKAVAGVKMPLISEEDWTRVDLDRVEKKMAESYSKLSPALIQLVVRMARLDVPPSAGIDRLCKEAAVLLDKARSGPSPAEVTRKVAE